MSMQTNEERLESLQKSYEQYKSQNLNLNMARGKPCPEQLDLSNGIMDILTSGDSLKSTDGTDLRNYGGIDGLPEAKELFSQILEVDTDEIVIGGNSSLAMMHDSIAQAMMHGVPDGNGPWAKQEKVKFLCPSPGYDRHFAICELFNIEMVIVDMKEDGPDMDQVEKLVREDEAVKGIWCVPKYSNPTGIVYSDEVVDRLASMETKAADFRIFWDNAYAIHHLTDEPKEIKNLLDECKKQGSPNRVLMFSSTSKVTFPGSGVAMLAASEENLDRFRKNISFQTIGPDKLNQKRHVEFFKNMDGLKAHMKKHAAIIEPKFRAVIEILDQQLSGKGIASWDRPDGGYFISLDTPEGCAKEVVSMASDLGVTLTGAGATFPYNNDPKDQNIRIAPTFPSEAELRKAIEVLCVCIELTSMKKTGQAS